VKTYTKDSLSWSDTQRRIDENGFMHVSVSHISKETVNPYLGMEIPGYLEKGLEGYKEYRVYRPGIELSKAAASFDGLPILIDHWNDTAETPVKEKRVGSTGTDGQFNSPYLDNSLHVTDAEAIRMINNGQYKQLSCAYSYEPVFEPGVFQGQPYDLYMTNIRGGHVALVPEGRAGPDVVVADKQIQRKVPVMGKIKELLMKLLGLVEEAEAGVSPDSLSAPGPDVDPAAAAPIPAPEITAEEVIAFLDGLEDKEKAEKVKAFIGKLAKPTDGESEIPAVDQEAVPPIADETEAVKTEPPKAADKRLVARQQAAKAIREALALRELGPLPPPPPTPAQVLDRKLIEDSVEKRVMEKYQRMMTAANDVRPLVGVISPMTFDSVEAIYSHALEKLGRKPVTKDAAALRELVLQAIEHNNRSYQPQAQAYVSSGDYTGVFAHLNKIRVAE
jgi:hypothetical protein